MPFAISEFKEIYIFFSVELKSNLLGSLYCFLLEILGRAEFE